MKNVVQKLKACIIAGFVIAIASCAASPAYAAETPWKYEHVHVDRVVDGDTADMTVDVGFNISFHHSFRFYGIDTPEKGQPGYKEATDAVKTLIDGKDVTIDAYKQDKYGRYLATIYVLGTDGKVVNVNDYLIQKGLAKSYFGGKRN